MNKRVMDEWVDIGRFWLNTRTGQMMPIIRGAALPATDAFTGADGAGLSANWTTDAGTFQIYSNSIRVTENDSRAWWDADAFGNDQYSQATAVAVAAWVSSGLLIRRTAANTYYDWLIHPEGSDLEKLVGGAYTGLASGGSDATNDVLRLEANGTTITCKKNGSETGTPGHVTDTSLTSGSAGICFYGSTGTTVRLDDFEGGNLGAAAVNITAAEDNQAQKSDAAVLGVFTPATPSQQNQAQVSDLVSLSLATTALTAAENNQAQVSDIAVLGVITPLAPSQQNQAQASDIATLGVYTPITAADDNQAQVSDLATFGVIHPLTAADNNQAQVSDEATLGVYTPISAADDNQAQVSDAATFGVVHPLSAADNNQAQVSDAAVLTSGEVGISAADNNQAQVSDAVTMTVVYPITAADNNQAQVSDAASITFSGIGIVNVTAADDWQAQVSDAAILGVFTPITPDDNNQAQVSDAVSISASGPEWGVTASDNNQAQVIDPASLTAIYILAAVENHQAQVSDLAVVSIGGVIEHGERRLYELNTRGNSVFATRPTHATKTRVDLEVDD